MSLAPTSDEVLRLWRAGWPYLHLEAEEAARATRVATAAAEAQGVPIYAWTATAGLTGRDDLASPEAALAAFAAGEGGALLLLHDLHRWLDDRRLVSQLRDLAPRLAAQGRCAAVVAPPFELPLELRSDFAVVPVPAPDAAELLALLEAGGPIPAASAGDDDPARRLVQAALGLPGSVAMRAFAAARAVPAGDDPVDLVLGEKRRHLRDAFALEVVRDRVGFDAVGGLEALKQWLGERAGAFTDEARHFGLPAPKGALLLGIQGCGKSLSAKAVAEHWRLPLLRLDLAAIFGGDTAPESGLRRALAAAEQMAPLVLWIDEIEKGFAGADPEAEGAVPAAARVLGAFATWLQEKTAPVFVVATANEVKGLPPELLRRGRFDEIFFVDLPDEPARSDILALHLRRRARDPGRFPVVELAHKTEHFSGAELEQVVVSALYRAFGAGRDLDGDDLVRAAADTVPLYRTYEERVKALRAWARGRARPAGRAEAVVDLLRGGAG